MRNFYVLVAAVAMVLFVVGCGGGGMDSVDSAQFSMSLSISPDTIFPTEYATVSCTLLHRTANSGQVLPVSNHEVVFSFAQNESGGKLTPLGPTTDQDGKISAVYQAGTKPGLDIIQAAIPEGVITRVSVVVGPEPTTTTTTLPPLPTDTTLSSPIVDD